jgi:7-cyano-7-deazaguanine synthase
MTVALLLSGGMDSIALAWWKRPKFAITIDYGQRPAAAEVRAASAVASALELEHHVLRCDLSALGTGDLAGSPALALAPVPEWWPFRNQMLLTLAAMKALSLPASSLMIGCLSTDAQHADGSKQFVDAINKVMALQEGSLQIVAPAIQHTAHELIELSQVPFEILAWAHSCHVANEACGVCRGCMKHYDTMTNLGHGPY